MNNKAVWHQRSWNKYVQQWGNKQRGKCGEQQTASRRLWIDIKVSAALIERFIIWKIKKKECNPLMRPSSAHLSKFSILHCQQQIWFNKVWWFNSEMPAPGKRMRKTHEGAHAEHAATTAVRDRCLIKTKLDGDAVRLMWLNYHNALH